MTDSKVGWKRDAADARPPAPRRDMPAKRPCLRCSMIFGSDGFGDRICPRCKSSKSWRSGIATTSGGTRRT